MSTTYTLSDHTTATLTETRDHGPQVWDVHHTVGETTTYVGRVLQVPTNVGTEIRAQYADGDGRTVYAPSVRHAVADIIGMTVLGDEPARDREDDEPDGMTISLDDLAEILAEVGEVEIGRAGFLSMPMLAEMAATLPDGRVLAMGDEDGPFAPDRDDVVRDLHAITLAIYESADARLDGSPALVVSDPLPVAYADQIRDHVAAFLADATPDLEGAVRAVLADAAQEGGEGLARAHDYVGPGVRDYGVSADQVRAALDARTYVCDGHEVDTSDRQPFAALASPRNGWTSTYDADADVFRVRTPYTHSARTYRRA